MPVHVSMFTMSVWHMELSLFVHHHVALTPTTQCKAQRCTPAGARCAVSKHACCQRDASAHLHACAHCRFAKWKAQQGKKGPDTLLQVSSPWTSPGKWTRRICTHAHIYIHKLAHPPVHTRARTHVCACLLLAASSMILLRSCHAIMSSSKHQSFKCLSKDITLCTWCP